MPKTKAENRKGILVVFDEEGGLDVSSVDASDFSVDGKTPTSVTVVDVFEDSKGNPSAKNRKAAGSLPAHGEQPAVGRQGLRRR